MIVGVPTGTIPGLANVNASVGSFGSLAIFLLNKLIIIGPANVTTSPGLRFANVLICAKVPLPAKY